MSTINQCTFALTGKTKLVQYYRECLTCSNDHGPPVGVCLNCVSICHENHQLGPLLREKFFCNCQQICQSCRALPSIYAEEEVSSGGNKKRKLPSGYQSTSGHEGNDSSYWVVWSKTHIHKKVLLSTHLTLNEANEKAKMIKTLLIFLYFMVIYFYSLLE